MDKEKKREAWAYGLKFCKMDNVKLSDKFTELVEKEINGEISTDEMTSIMKEYYEK